MCLMVVQREVECLRLHKLIAFCVLFLKYIHCRFDTFHKYSYRLQKLKLKLYSFYNTILKMPVVKKYYSNFKQIILICQLHKLGFTLTCFMALKLLLKKWQHNNLIYKETLKDRAFHCTRTQGFTKTRIVLGPQISPVPYGLIFLIPGH